MGRDPRCNLLVMNIITRRDVSHLLDQISLWPAIQHSYVPNALVVVKLCVCGIAILTTTNDVCIVMCTRSRFQDTGHPSGQACQIAPNRLTGSHAGIIIKSEP